ncbi:MAG: hypothetical protein KA248_11940 [Kiritimatiellae bacterium]|nr:hypothetical protein [Kiritimatiellia bacterium]
MNTIQRLRLATTTLILLASSSRAAQESVAYTYDDSGRLVTAAWSMGCSNAAAHYQYDANGSRTGTIHVAANDTSVDTDGDGMPDLGELAFFGGLNADGAGDPDGDGLVTSNELALLGNPFRADTDEDEMSDLDEAIAGTRLNDPLSFFALLRLSVATGGVSRASWDARAGRTYQLETSAGPLAAWTNIGAPYVSTHDGSYSAEQPLGTAVLYRARVRLTE